MTDWQPTPVELRIVCGLETRRYIGLVSTNMQLCCRKQSLVQYSCNLLYWVIRFSFLPGSRSPATGSTAATSSPTATTATTTTTTTPAATAATAAPGWKCQTIRQHLHVWKLWSPTTNDLTIVYKRKYQNIFFRSSTR